MTLAITQRAFQAHVVGDEAPVPPHWDGRFVAGMAIYRNAYRARLIEALLETFPRTCEWVGEQSFVRAAAHHLISAPPSGWTLDEVGLGFPEVLGQLFASDPEVSELAWLEWVMHRAFTAADAVAMDPAGFAAATADFAADDWNDLRLTFLPGTALRTISTCCDHIWRALSHGSERPGEVFLPEPSGLVVWREGLSPVFQRIDALEIEAIQQMMAGNSFGSLCEFMHAERGPAGLADAGAMLGDWVARGMLAACEARRD